MEKRPIGILEHLGPVWVAPDAWDPMTEEELAEVEGMGPDDPLSGFRK
jgi:hypothetical protein